MVANRTGGWRPLAQQVLSLVHSQATVSYSRAKVGNLRFEVMCQQDLWWRGDIAHALFMGNYHQHPSASRHRQGAIVICRK